MNAHRYPLRAANGEQLLQKRTRPAQSMADKDKRILNDPFNGPNQENSSSFANKKLRRDMSHHQQQPPYKQGGFKANDMKLKKTNPRLANMKASNFGNEPAAMNHRKGKQMKKIEGKDHQHQFMQYPTMMPQYPMQYQAMAPQMMAMGMQFPMQQMNPHMVGYHQNPQIAEMQKQINILSQMTMMQSQMHQMQQMNHENMFPKQDFSQMQSQQFRGQYFPQTDQQYGGMYGGFPPQMPNDASETYQEQEEYYEEDQDSQQQDFSQHSQDETNELQADRSDQEVKPTKQAKKLTKAKDTSLHSSPKRDDSDLKNRKDDSLNRQKRNQSGENELDSGKQAPNSRMREIPDSRGKHPMNQQKNAQQARNAKKNKLHDIHDNRNIIDDGGSNVRRTTRSMLNKTSHRRQRLGQAKDSEKKKDGAQGKMPQGKQKSDSRSPQTSPVKDRTPRKQSKMAPAPNSQEESSQQITQRETRYSSRLSSAKQSLNVNGKAMTDKQKQLQQLKEEIEAEAFKGRELSKMKSMKQNQRKSSQGHQDSTEKRKTRGRGQGNQKKTPTKDEMLLFGAGQSDFDIHDKPESHMLAQQNTTSNPLLKRHRKEAQTEIVDRRYEEDMQNRVGVSKSVYQNDSVDEEEEPNHEEMMQQMQNEKNRLQKQVIMDEQQLKDMRILFGIPDDEVEAIKRQQDEYLQKMKDQQMLFGDEGQTGDVNEFSTPNPVNVKKEPIKTESQNSEVKLTRVIADNRVIDVDQSKDVKTEQEEILLFNDNSTTQDHQMLQQRHVKDEQVKQNNHQAQDINIILEVQKPADSSSQDLKLEKGMLNDPSSAAVIIKQQKLTVEDERLLFSDDPINSSSLAAGAHHKNSTLLPATSISPVQQQAQLTSNINYQMMMQNDLIGHEPDDTFKVDEEAVGSKGAAARYSEEAYKQKTDHRFPAGVAQGSQESQDVLQEGAALQDLVVEERPSDKIESMQMKQENLRKQIELLQQQIDQDKKMMTESGYSAPIQQASFKKPGQFMGQQHEMQFHGEPNGDEDIEEYRNQFEEKSNEQKDIIHHEEEMDENDQIMQEHDERDFEVNLEQENNVTSYENQEAHMPWEQRKFSDAQQDEQKNECSNQGQVETKFAHVNSAEEKESARDITKLVDHLQLPDSFELLATFVSHLDQGLNILHSRGQRPTFSHLRQIIASQAQRNFTLNHVKQILSLQPNLYLHHWEFRQEKYDLIFHIPSNADELVRSKAQDANAAHQTAIQLPITQTLMRARVASVRKQLLKKVYDAYLKFMQNHSHRLGSQNNSQPDHDIFVTRRWPGMFDLNNPRLVPEIATTGNHLKEQPSQRPRQETVQEFVQRNDHKEKIREAVQEANRQINRSDNQSEQDSQEYSDSSDEARRRSKKPTVQTGIKETTMAVVRMKDQMETKAKEKALENQQKNESQKNVESHIKCSEQIKSIMSFHQGSTMKLRDMIQKLHNSHSSAGHFVAPCKQSLSNSNSFLFSTEQVRQQIQTISKILPEWISHTEAGGQLYIKVAKNLNLQQYEISQKIQAYFTRQQHFASNLQVSQENSSNIHNQKRRERLDSEQARLRQQGVERGHDSQRMTKSCPPISAPSQSQEQSGLIQSSQHLQHSAQERSQNQSALSQKSNSLSHRQQEAVHSPHNVSNGNKQQAYPNLSNQQQAQAIKKSNQSAFQPYQKAPQSQGLQSNSENHLNHLNKYQTDMNDALDSEMAVEKNHSLANLGGASGHFYGSGGRPQNGYHQQQQHPIQPSSNSLFKQINTQNSRAQAVQKGTGGQRNASGENHGSSGTYLTGSCESARNPHEQMEGGDTAQRASNSNTRYQNGYNSKQNGSYSNGIDVLLNKVMSSNGEHLPPKNYSPVKRDNPHQRQEHGAQQPGSSHPNIYESNSISASMGGAQFGNDLYQALASSSRGRGYSGSPYGAAPSHNTHHQSLLAINDDEADDLDNGRAVHNHHLDAPNLTNFRMRPEQFQGNLFNNHQSHQQHSRNRMNSSDRDGGQHFNGKFNGQHGYY